MSTPVETQHPGRASHSWWPSVIGIICIINGSFEAFRFLVCGTFYPWFLNRPFDPSPVRPPGHDAQLLASNQNVLNMFLWNVFAGVSAVLLVVGGIGVLRRRQIGPRLCRLWAMLKIVHALGAMVLLYFVIWIQIGGLLYDPYPTLGSSDEAQFNAALALLGMLIAFAWRVALPIFIHEWFSWDPIRRQVASWAPEGICPTCGYDLRGELDAGCPECGWNREADAVESGGA